MCRNNEDPLILAVSVKYISHLFVGCSISVDALLTWVDVNQVCYNHGGSIIPPDSESFVGTS